MPEKLTCSECSKEFPNAKSLRNHKRNHDPFLKCQQCDYGTKRPYLLQKHLRTVHGNHQRQHPLLVKSEEDSVESLLNLFNSEHVPNPGIRDLYKIDIHRDRKHILKSRFIDFSVSFVKPKDEEKEEEKDLSQVLDTLNGVFENLLWALSKKAKPMDRCRFVMLSDAYLDPPCSIPMIQVSNASAVVLTSAVANILQSKDEFDLDKVHMNFVHIELPEEAGYSKFGTVDRRKVLDIGKFLTGKRCLVEIPNFADEMCAARALVIGLLFTRGLTVVDLGCLSVRDLLMREEISSMALDLHLNCGIAPGPVNIDGIKKFQQHPSFSDVEINVYSSDLMGKRLWRSPLAKEKKICLLIHQNHYWLINSMKAFRNCKFYCFQCDKTAKSETAHRCSKAKCRFCKQDRCANKSEIFVDKGTYWCNECNRFWCTMECLICHAEIGTCGKWYRCAKCHQTVSRNKTEKHDSELCGTAWCRVCACRRETGHEFCWMSVYQPKTKQKEFVDDTDSVRAIDLLGGDGTEEEEEGQEEGEGTETNVWYFDFEADIISGENHRPNLVVVQRFDGEQKHKFIGRNCVDTFLEWIFNYEAGKTTRVFMAHNLKSYDGYFILNFFYRNHLRCDVLIRNQNILQLTYKPKKIVFKDTLCFIPMRLAEFPKAFGFQEEETKGYFPLLMNSEEMISTNGGMKHGDFPPLAAFLPYDCHVKEKEAIEEWWKAESTRYRDRGLLYSIQTELIRYCEQDVKVLRLGAEKFRSLFFEYTGIDPYVEACTISSASHLAFRKDFLDPVNKPLLVVSPHGLEPRTKTSNKSNIWLKWIEHRNPGLIIQREKRIGKYTVDGYVENCPELSGYENCEGRKVVFEFFGCLFHGCVKTCYDPSHKNPFNQQTMGQCYAATVRKMKYLTRNDYRVVEIWEHDFDLLLSEKSELEAFIKDVGLCTCNGIAPREALFGGRTDCISMYCKVNPAIEKIVYLDICSLYPWVNIFCPFPVGAPKIVYSNFGEEVWRHFGLWQGIILPPRELFHPVLPARSSDGKLMFSLCQKCQETGIATSECGCSDEERAMHGCWYTGKIELAVCHSYKIIKTCCMWIWDQNQIRTDIFRDYLMKFVSLKLKASGLPDYLKSDKQIQQFVDELNTEYSLDLRVEDFQKNDSLRSLSKIILNSFWGRFGMRINLSSMELVDSYERLVDLFNNPNVEINEFVEASERLILIGYKNVEETAPPLPNLSMVIALLTTAHARIKLYSYLEQAYQITGSWESILYMDTDSMIVKVDRDGPQIPVSDALGGLKDELSGFGSDSYGLEFWSSGPKSWGLYVMTPGKTEGKWLQKNKGISLSWNNLQIVSPDRLRDEILADPRNAELEILNQRRIRKDKKKAEIYTRNEKKTWQVCVTKRVLNETNLGTKPFGYSAKQRRLEE